MIKSTVSNNIKLCIFKFFILNFLYVFEIVCFILVFDICKFSFNLICTPNGRSDHSTWLRFNLTLILSESANNTPCFIFFELFYLFLPPFNNWLLLLAKLKLIIILRSTWFLLKQLQYAMPFIFIILIARESYFIRIIMFLSSFSYLYKFLNLFILFKFFFH